MKDALRKLKLTDNHRKYLAWKVGNAHVWALIKTSVLKLVAGGQRFSIEAVVNYVRSKEFFEGCRDEPYRINHNHVVYIAHDLRKECPEIDEFIQVRVKRGEKEKKGSGPSIPPRLYAGTNSSLSHPPHNFFSRDVRRPQS